jgi:hypothetical protein
MVGSVQAFSLSREVYLLTRCFMSFHNRRKVSELFSEAESGCACSRSALSERAFTNRSVTY